LKQERHANDAISTALEMIAEVFTVAFCMLHVALVCAAQRRPLHISP
jgi:hypothetical protein